MQLEEEKINRKSFRNQGIKRSVSRAELRGLARRQVGKVPAGTFCEDKKINNCGRESLTAARTTRGGQEGKDGCKSDHEARADFHPSLFLGINKTFGRQISFSRRLFRAYSFCCWDGNVLRDNCVLLDHLLLSSFILFKSRVKVRSVNTKSCVFTLQGGKTVPLAWPEQLYRTTLSNIHVENRPLI